MSNFLFSLVFSAFEHYVGYPSKILEYELKYSTSAQDLFAAFVLREMDDAVADDRVAYYSDIVSHCNSKNYRAEFVYLTLYAFNNKDIKTYIRELVNELNEQSDIELSYIFEGVSSFSRIFFSKGTDNDYLPVSLDPYTIIRRAIYSQLDFYADPASHAKVQYGVNIPSEFWRKIRYDVWTSNALSLFLILLDYEINRAINENRSFSYEAVEAMCDTITPGTVLASLKDSCDKDSALISNIVDLQSKSTKELTGIFATAKTYCAEFFLLPRVQKTILTSISNQE